MLLIFEAGFLAFAFQKSIPMETQCRLERRPQLGERPDLLPCDLALMAIISNIFID